MKNSDNQSFSNCNSPIQFNLDDLNTGITSMAANHAIKIGVVATLIGPYEVMGREALAGVQMAVDEFGGQVAGKRIEVAIRGSNAIPDSAVDAVQSLLD